VYFPLYLFYYFIENLFGVKYCTRLKYTFGIRDLLASRDALMFKGLAQDCDKPYYSGISMILIF
jgi:hypothetical protein